jgi:hypothetical protein
VFVDGQPQVEVAQRFGYTYNTLRRLVSDFHAQYRADQVPPFSCPRCMVVLPVSAPMPLSSIQIMRLSLRCVVAR